MTLDHLEIWTNSDLTSSKEQGKEKSFNKLVRISSLGVYWQPRERSLYSETSYQEDHVRDNQFRSNIAR